MDDISFLDVSAVLGLFAASLLTLNILFGMLLATAYKRSPLYKKLPAKIKQWSLNDIHNWTAYIALSLVVLHIVFLLLNTPTKFTLTDVLLPVNAPHQKLEVAFGTIALYALITAIVTTQKGIRKKMGFRLWKNIHLISYGTALLFVIHGILLDPDLKDSPVDWLDGEKLVPEFCGIILIIAVVIRWRHHRRLKK